MTLQHFMANNGDLPSSFNYRYALVTLALSSFFFFYRLFLDWLIDYVERHHGVGPLAKNILQKLQNRLYHAYTKKFLFYQEKIVKGREDTKTNTLISETFARYERTTLNGFCNSCVVYGHQTDATVHGITSEAIALAKYYNLYNAAKLTLTKEHTYTIAFVRAFEKNPRSFIESNGQSTILPTRIAVASIESLNGNALKTYQTAAGIIYVNNTIQVPHYYFYAYDSVEQLRKIVTVLSTAVEHYTVYTEHEIKAITNLASISKTQPEFTNNIDLTDTVEMELRRLKREATILRPLDVVKEEINTPQDTQIDEIDPVETPRPRKTRSGTRPTKAQRNEERRLEQQQSTPKTKPMRYNPIEVLSAKKPNPVPLATPTTSKNQANTLQDNQLTSSTSDITSKAEKKLAPGYKSYTSLMPTFAMALCIISCAIIPTNAKICSSYTPINYSDVVLSGPTSKVNEQALCLNTAQQNHLQPFYNYLYSDKKCYSVDGNEWSDLIAISLHHKINLENIIKPASAVLEKYITNAVKAGDILLFSNEQKAEFNLLQQLYDAEIINYYGNFGDVSDALNMFIATNATYLNVLQEDLKTRKQHIVFLQDDAEFTCNPLNCQRFSGYDETPRALKLKIKATLTRTINHAPNGKILLINQACYDTCACIDTHYHMQQEEPVQSMTEYPTEFYEESRYFQRYHARIYDAILDDTFTDQSYVIERHVYQHTQYCIHKDKKNNCVYDPKDFSIDRCKNYEDFEMQCPTDDSFCMDAMHVFCPMNTDSTEITLNKPAKIAPEVESEKPKILARGIVSCDALTELETTFTPTQLRQLSILTRDANVDATSRGIVVFYNEQSELKYVKQLAYIMQSCIDTHKKPSFIIGKELNIADNIQDYGHVITQLKPTYEKSNIVTVLAAHEIDCVVYQAFHAICDDFTPFVPTTTTIFAIEAQTDSMTALEAYAETFYERHLQCMPKNKIQPLIARITQNVLRIQAQPKQEIVMVKQPITESTRTEITKTLEHYINTIRTHYDNIVKMLNTKLQQIELPKFTFPDFPTHIVIEFYNSALDTIRDHFYNVHQQISETINTWKRNYRNHFVLSAKHYQANIASLDEIELCEVLHHIDTIEMYNDCKVGKLQNPIFLYYPRFGASNVEYKIENHTIQFTRDTYAKFTEAIGYIYKGTTQMFYRPLFTNPNEVVVAYHKPNHIQHCYTLDDPSEHAIIFREDNTYCYPYVTGMPLLDSLIADWYVHFIAIVIAFTLIPTMFVQYNYADRTGMRLFVLIMYIAYNGVTYWIMPSTPFTWIVSWLLDFSVLFNKLLGFLLVTFLAYFSLLAWMLYHAYSELKRTKNLTYIASIAMSIGELVCYGIGFYSNYICGNPWIAAFIASVITTTCYYYSRYHCRASWTKNQVTMAQAAIDWCDWRKECNNASDDMAKFRLNAVMQKEIGALDTETLLRYTYLVQCYTNVVNTTYDPKHMMIIKRVNLMNIANAHNGLTNRSETVLMNKNTMTNPSTRYVLPEFPLEYNPHIIYTQNGIRSALYGAVVDGHLCIERHLFGSDQTTFDTNYADGKGLKYCNIKASEYDLDNVHIVKTIIRIPLLTPRENPFTKHPNPLEYTGAAIMKIGAHTVNGFIQEGHHDMQTWFGDCGGMIFTKKGQFLGLHCAGSADVVFRKKDGTPNIWTRFTRAHPTELMITVDGEINLPAEYIEDYDFKNVRMSYQHPLRDVYSTLQTLQHLTNPSNTEYAYDTDLMDDFNITKESYDSMHLFVNYENFRRNFAKYTKETIGSNGIEYCMKYGLRQVEKTSDLQNESVQQIYSTFDYVGVSFFCMNLYLFITAIYYADYFAAAIFCINYAAHYFKARTSDTIKVSFNLIAITYYLARLYYSGCSELIGLVCTIREFVQYTKWSKPLEAVLTLMNHSSSEVVAKDMATELGNSRNLCIHLSTILKTLKSNPAFYKLDQVVNTLDDLQAAWDTTADAKEQLDANIAEIFAIYPALFVILTKMDDYDTQIRMITSYLGDKGEFDLYNFEEHYKPKDSKTHYDQYEQNCIEKSDEMETRLLENTDLQKSCALISKALRDVKIDPDSINDEALPELITYFVQCTQDYDESSQKLLELLVDRIIILLKEIKNDPEQLRQTEFADMYMQLVKNRDYLATTVNTMTPKQRNMFENTQIRLIAQMKRAVNALDQYRTQQAQAEVKQHRKEAASMLQENNRIRKLQRQNQNIACAIYQMVHACLANRFMLQNQGNTVPVHPLVKRLPEISCLLEELGVPEENIHPDTEILSLVNEGLTDINTMQRTLWSGVVYSNVPSICGKENFFCNVEHTHSLYNCNKIMFAPWYKHVESCQECRKQYNEAKHPRCGLTYDTELIARTKRPSYINFVTRYHTCEQCKPCTDCIITRDPYCRNDLHHFDAKPKNVVHNEAFLTPVSFSPNSVDYKHDEPQNQYTAVWNGKTVVIRYEEKPVVPVARFRYLNYVRSDPTGHYYVAESFPNNIDYLNAIINHITSMKNGKTSTNLSNQTEIGPQIQTETSHVYINRKLPQLELAELKKEHKLLVQVINAKETTTYNSAIVEKIKELLPTSYVVVVSDPDSELSRPVMKCFINYVLVDHRTFDYTNIVSTVEKIAAIAKEQPDFPFGNKH